MALIAGQPMIVHVFRRAVEAKLGEVVVACDGRAIAQAVESVGGKAVLTDPDLPSGSDRIYQALTHIDPGKKYDMVVNVQGDMPTLDPAVINAAAKVLGDPQVDIGTVAAVITDEEEKNDSNVVKVVVSGQRPAAGGQAVSFSRTYSPGAFHHIGIYAYRRAALEKFVHLPPSTLEKREKLEQLRALEAGMRIDVAVVNTVPLGVDTLALLEKAKGILEHKQGR